MSQLPEDWTEFPGALDAHHVDYLVVGGVALGRAWPSDIEHLADPHNPVSH